MVTVVHGRHDHLARQRASLALSTVAPDDHVVVAVDDPVVAAAEWCATSVPGDPIGLPIAAARNAGADVALDRGADVLVFLDVDCLVAPGLVAAYAEVARAEPLTVWSGPVTYLDAPPPGGYDLATDEITAEAETYAAAREQIDRRVPEGWRVIAVRRTDYAGVPFLTSNR